MKNLIYFVMFIIFTLICLFLFPSYIFISGFIIWFFIGYFLKYFQIDIKINENTILKN